jgi:hypothetical protein
MSIRIVFFLLATGLLLASATARSENTIDIKGSGNSQLNIDTSATNSSAIDIYQVGSVLVNKVGDSSPVTQVGNNHTARIGQGASYAAGTWTASTPVSNNSATINQSGVSSDMAAIYQISSSNTASIIQSSSDQSATVTQSSSINNSATLTQNGAAALQANIIQNGAAASTLIATQSATSAYTLTVNQGDSGGHTASIETSSDYNGAGVTVNQTGSANSASVTGMSGGSASISQSGTGGTVNLANQSNGVLTIDQQGTSNALGITNYDSGVSLSVTQTGAGTSYNPSSPPSGPTYTSSP